MPAADTSYIIGVIRELEKGFLQPDEYTRLIEAPTITESIHVLADTPYGPWLPAADASPHAVFSALTQHLASLQRWLGDVAPKDWFLSFISTRYDALNLASALLDKAHGAQEPSTLSPLGSIAPSVIESVVWQGLGWEYIPAQWEQYVRDCNSEDAVAAEETHSQTIRLEAERVAVHHLRALAKASLARDIASHYSDRLWVDYVLREQIIPTSVTPSFATDNITGTSSVAALAARLQEAGYPELTEAVLAGVRSQTDALTYELQWDAILMRLLQSARYEVVGWDPIVAFWQAKELEVKTLRLLISAKLNALPAEQLRALQRPLYVTPAV